MNRTEIQAIITNAQNAAARTEKNLETARASGDKKAIKLAEMAHDFALATLQGIMNQAAGC